MSLISRTADLFYAYRFIKLLVTPWEKTEAFEFGIVDDNGKVLKKTSALKTSEEKAAYTVFHRLVFNIKRLLNKSGVRAEILSSGYIGVGSKIIKIK